MIKKIFQKTADILLRPFKEHFLFFMVLCTLSVCCHFIGYFTVKNEINLNAAIVLAMHCVTLSYLASLIVSVIRPRVLRQILQALFIIYAAFDFALNMYCALYLHLLFDNDIALLIKETDPKEAVEFFSTMVPWWIMVTVAGAFLLLGLLGWLIKRRNLHFNLGHKGSLCAMGIVCLCILGCLYRWGSWKQGPLAPFYEFTQNENPAALRDYFTHPQLTFENKDDLPANVVLIIGESFSRSHSSMYGYNKPTNPMLAELKEDATLFSFDSINSPAHSTVLSLRYMLSTFDLTDENKGKKWYEFISLIELMDECGFNSYWFGNQGRVGAHNGTTRTYADACDEQWFLKKDDVEDQLDAVLVDSTHQYVDQISHKNHNFIVFHMKGSHFDYSKRYPQEYARFTVNDYQSEPESHRGILSSYDNSILYNDYIVKRIIDLFKDTESIIVYLPDHGQVMYRNKKDPDYYAHGRKADPVDYAYGIDIPFFIYASPLYQQKHPQVMERIKYRQDNPTVWNSDYLPYFFMDLVGVKDINGENVHSKSLLN